MRIALDTNAYSALQRGQAPRLFEAIKSANSIGFIYTVDAELRAGFKKGRHEKDNCAKLHCFQALDSVELYFADLRTDEIYASIWAELAKSGTPIPTNDVWIAAVCLQHHLTLATSDPYFKKMPLLQTISGNQ